MGKFLNINLYFSFPLLSPNAYYSGRRNCTARQQTLQIILDLADESSKRNIII